MSASATESQPGLDWLLPWRLAGAFAAHAAGPLIGAPGVLTQPINTGFVFNSVVVSPSNSRSPETEREIVSRHSYGRQIGRVMDAVAVLIKHSGLSESADACIEDFQKLQREIDNIKKKSATRRVERFLADLETLERDNVPEFKELTEKLRAILDRA